MNMYHCLQFTHQSTSIVYESWYCCQKSSVAPLFKLKFGQGIRAVVTGSAFTIRLLGSAGATSFHLQPGPTPHIPQKIYQLLALIILSPGRRIRRSKAASFLWGNTREEVALGNLRQVLNRFRNANLQLGKIIDWDANQLWLLPGANCIDLCQFLDNANATVLPLYDGQLLDGLEDDSESYSVWLSAMRAQLNNQFLRRSHDYLMDSTRYARCDKSSIYELESRMLGVEPEREASYRSLIEAYGRVGLTDDARRISKQLENVLRSEFGTSSSRETYALTARVVESSLAFRQADVGVTREKMLPPRVAFLAPRWIHDQPEIRNTLNALIEDVANEMARYQTFVMLAPHSSFQVTHDSGLPEDNSLLRADYTISGFVKPNRALSLRMTHFNTQQIVWTGEFATENVQWLECFRQLTLRISTGLAGGIEKHFAEQIRLSGSHVAYASYLAGQNAMLETTLGNLRRARRHFLAAVSEDPHFSNAHARIAQTLYQEWLMLGAEDALILKEARRRSDHALAIDGNNGVSQWMGAVIALYQRDFDSCEEYFRAANVLVPNSPELMLQHGDALAHLAEADVGMDKFKLALDVNPMPTEHYWWVGAGIALYQRNFGEAINYCSKMKNEDCVLRILACAHAHIGDRREAERYGQRLREVYPEISLAKLKKIPPNKNPDDTEMYIEGLRMAGIN